MNYHPPGPRKIIRTAGAPAAIGPYSQAVQTGQIVFTCGQIALGPGSGEIEGTTVAAQTVRALTNLEAVVEAAGSSMEQVLKTTVYLIDMADFSEMNTAYARFFGDSPPARSCVAVSGLPKGSLVEIEAVALSAAP